MQRRRGEKSGFEDSRKHAGSQGLSQVAQEPHPPSPTQLSDSDLETIGLMTSRIHARHHGTMLSKRFSARQPKSPRIKISTRVHPPAPPRSAPLPDSDLSRSPATTPNPSPVATGGVATRDRGVAGIGGGMNSGRWRASRLAIMADRASNNQAIRFRWRIDRIAVKACRQVCALVPWCQAPLVHRHRYRPRNLGVIDSLAPCLIFGNVRNAPLLFRVIGISMPTWQVARGDVMRLSPLSTHLRVAEVVGANLVAVATPSRRATRRHGRPRTWGLHPSSPPWHQWVGPDDPDRFQGRQWT